MSVSKTGLTFNAQANVGATRTQTVPGVSAGSSGWSFSTVSQSDFLNISNASASLTVGVKPMAAPGTYYGLILVTPNTPGAPTTLVTVVYNVTADSPAPELSTSGPICTVTPGANTPAQSFSLLPSTSGSQPYTLKAQGSFLTLANQSGSLGGAGSTPVSISINSGQLRQGLNRGSVQVSLPNGVTRTVDVAAILQPPVVPGATPANCAASQIVVVGTSIAGGFSQPAGEPVGAGPHKR